MNLGKGMSSVGGNRVRGGQGLDAGLVVLGEAGNLGDDLILLAALEALGATGRVEKVRYLSHDSPLDWSVVRQAFPSMPALEPVHVRYEYPFETWSARAFADCDLVIFGGGGLLQNTHHPMRPYHWLRFLPKGRPAYSVGLGLGPLSWFWRSYLRRGPFFERTYLRDHQSIDYARSLLHWDAKFAHDFVDFPFLEAMGGARDRSSLGVALRDWPGLDEERVVAEIVRLSAAHGHEKVEFFVLESKDGVGADVDMTRRIAARISSLPCEVHVYQGGDPIGFVERMRGCAEAISMKLHSSAIWASTGIPMFPVVYAPKVAAFFDLPWRGLEIIDRPIVADFPKHPIPRSREMVVDIVNDFAARGTSRRVGRGERVVFQVTAFVIDLVRKLRATAGATRRRARRAR